MAGFAQEWRNAVVAQRGDQEAQHVVTYTIQGRNGHGMTVVERFKSTDHAEAYREGVAYWRECGAGRHEGIREVVMMARNYWGEVSVSGRWGV